MNYESNNDNGQTLADQCIITLSLICRLQRVPQHHILHRQSRDQHHIDTGHERI